MTAKGKGMEPKHYYVVLDYDDERNRIAKLTALSFMLEVVVKDGIFPNGI